MKKNSDFINEKKEEIEKDLSFEKGKKIFSDVVGVVSTIILLAFAALASGIGAQLAYICAAILCAMVHKRNSCDYSNKIARLDNELAHLNKLSVSNLISNRDSMSKKVLKSKNLQEELKKVNKEYNSNFLKTFSFVGATSVFSLLSMFVNPFCFIGAFLLSLMVWIFYIYA